MRILVAGAGIGGLVAARLLARAGHDVVVAEQAPALRAAGAGLVLTAETVRVLRSAGVTTAGTGLELPRLSVTTARGRRRAQVRHRVSFARADLMDVLSAGLEHSVEVRHGVRLELVAASRDGVRCRLDGRETVADLLVAADGMRSTVRSALTPEPIPLRSAGQVCW